ncbi:MAG: beta-lactamase family protein [Actinomycetota bacterium]|nr:beta-lactamase family protein [Actinomycetota bacterium]
MRIATAAGGRHAPLVCGPAVLAVVAAFTALAAFTAVAAFAAAGSGAASPHRASVAAAESASDARVQRDLRELVAAPGGPPGAIATLFREGRTTVLTAGVADVGTRRPPRATDYMRIASIAKAFSGAVTLELVRRGRLRLDDTIARRLPGLPRAWGRVTIRELLDHTSGLPDYTESKGFRDQFETDPTGYVPPSRIISWVANERLNFAPGSRYRYSNTDNIVIGLIAERATGRSYGSLLRASVFAPLGLRHTSFPTGVRLPRPYLHGYVTEPGASPHDVSESLSPSGAWASGAIVSTPLDLGAFIRGYVSGRLFGSRLLRQQRQFVLGGASSPPGPGANAAGLALFRYRTRCGTVYGHTGNFPGYVQWAAATGDGRRSVTSSLNIPAPTGRLLARLRAMQADAVCALLAGGPSFTG